MSKLEKLKDKAKALEAKDPKGAIEAWLEVLKLQEDDAEPNPDLSLYNRVGDLYLKLRDPAQAADTYERAVDRYADLGFHNNAIAMCNKVLRNAPGRQLTYLKLAKLYASKGFFAEAKQNFVEYAERMQKAGHLQQAFAALKELTDLAPENSGFREMLGDHLRTYGEPEQRTSQRLSQAKVATPVPSKDDLMKSGKRKTTSLVFLDLDEPAKTKGAAPAAPAAPRAPVPAPPRPAPAPPPPVAEDDHLEIETTTLTGADAEPSAAGLDGLETRIEFGDVHLGSSVPSLREEPTPEGDTLSGLEPTSEPEIEPLELESTELESTELESTELESTELEPPPPRPAPPKAAPARPLVPVRAAAPPPAAAPPTPTPAPRAPAFRVGPPPAPARVVAPAPSPVVPKRPAPPPAPRVSVPAKPPAEPPRPVRPTLVEVPPLELEPDFQAATTAGHHDVDDAPLADDADDAPMLDLGVEGIMNQDLGADMFAGLEEEPAPAASSVDELEAKVADDPDDPDLHRALAEALIEAGERDRGIEELDIAVNGYENRADLPAAEAIVDELLRIDPNSVRHRQKRVEYAFKAGEKARLIDAYVELADTLLRTDLPDKARAVYLRVAEHDPRNQRAQSALALLAPTNAAPAAPAAREERVAPKDAKMTVRDTAATAGDFIDLGSLILDHDEPRDSRMKVEEEEPTGDEEKDFHEMLARFRQGIDENIDEGDFQSHYDLGVAFKEMGLVDEAIAEFQKALRAPEGKLRAVEALGGCFLEKGAFVVAESILRRGLELPAASEQDRLGVLYSLARALEGQGRKPDARDLYQRVFAVDIGFKDVGERMKALGKAK